jgi:hypothetical protein
MADLLVEDVIHLAVAVEMHDQTVRCPSVGRLLHSSADRSVVDGTGA